MGELVEKPQQLPVTAAAAAAARETTTRSSSKEEAASSGIVSPTSCGGPVRGTEGANRWDVSWAAAASAASWVGPTGELGEGVMRPADWESSGSAGNLGLKFRNLLEMERLLLSEGIDRLGAERR